MSDNVTHFPGGRGGKRKPSGTWHDHLLRNDRGTFRANLANALISLRHCPLWKGRIAFDKFAGKTMVIGNLPWEMTVPLDDYQAREWTGIDAIRLTEWLQLENINVGHGTADLAAEAVAHERAFDPVKDYLRSIKWDGTRRLNGWLSTYLGCPVNLYTVGVGIRWMVSAVARVDVPGAKVDHVLILEGGQGPGKSTALEILGGPWFTDQLSNLDSKDSSVDLQGAWIVELGELDSIAKADISRVKQFLTRRVDRFRPPYGRRVESFPRRCVFAGTHNPTGPWNKDATGGRRFWPVKVGGMDLAGLERDRDQLWAEAVHYYLEGFEWWITHPEEIGLAENEQLDRQEMDAWHDAIADWLDDPASPRDHVTVGEILQNVCGLEMKHRGQREQNRVASVLTTLGWERRQYRPDPEKTPKKRTWAYFRKESGDRKKPMESTSPPAGPVTTMGLSPVSPAESGDRNSPLESTMSPVSPVSPLDSEHRGDGKTPSVQGAAPTGDTGDAPEFKGKKPVTSSLRHTGDKGESGDRLSAGSGPYEAPEEFDPEDFAP